MASSKSNACISLFDRPVRWENIYFQSNSWTMKFKRIHSRSVEVLMIKPSGEKLIPGRRALLGGGVAVFAANTFVARLMASTTLAPAVTQAQDVTIEDFSSAGTSLGPVHVAKVIKSDAEWRSQLSP